MAKSIGELNSAYQEADAACQDLFAEQRSNILLSAGYHYHKRGNRFKRMVDNNRNMSSQDRVRITKNHIQYIVKMFTNEILRHSPGTNIYPKNENELQDQKSAELHRSVWADLQQRHKLKILNRRLIKDFVEIGEAFVKIFFDPMKGQFLGYDQEFDEMGMPVGEPVAKFTGDITYERIFGFNLLTDQNAKSWEEANVIYRKMVPTKSLKARYKGDETKLGYIADSIDETYQIFDGLTGRFYTAKDMTMVREHYYRPSAEFPNGYYYITVGGSGILEEGELPLGIFPILYVGFDEAVTSPRSYSIIKQVRPYQAEINRCASQAVLHSITLGDDKVLLQAGSKLANGGMQHGVRALTYTGAPPTILGGRTGEQYLEYMRSQIEEMYRVAGIHEDREDAAQVTDLQALLYRSMKDKKRYVIYAEKIEGFFVDITTVSLQLAKAYYSDEMIVPAVGRVEAVNIPEFRNSDDLHHQVKIEPQTEDVESVFGRSLQIQNLLQYAGKQLSPDHVGILAKYMPFLNEHEMIEELSDMTIDMDNVKSDILAMDRGQFVPAEPDDNHQYYVRRLSARIKKKDFQLLDPQIQQMYHAKRDQHRQFLVKQQQDIQRAQSGFIPADGMLVTVDMYIPNPNDPTKQQRARIPYTSLQWLIEKLQQQGLGQEAIADMDLANKAALAQSLVNDQYSAPFAQGPEASGPMLMA